MLRNVKDFREKINGSLKILGILANRTYARVNLTQAEGQRLTELAKDCKEIWGLPVPIFKSIIHQSKDVRDAEDNFSPVSSSTDCGVAFDALAQEILELLPSYCCTKRQANHESETEINT